MRNTLLAVFFSLSFAVLAVGQTFRGAISGSVADTSGAIIVDADVKIVNAATGLNYPTLSSSSGGFSLQDLPVGDYTISVSKAGFQNVRIDSVRVSAGQVYNLPVKLNVAQQTTMVEVSAATLAVETTNTTLTTDVPSRTVQDLPLNGRDFTQMIALSPGFAGYPGGANGSVNGARANQVNWQIEGTDNNDQWWNIMAVNQGGVQSIPAPSCRSTLSRSSPFRPSPDPKPAATRAALSTWSSNPEPINFTARPITTTAMKRWPPNFISRLPERPRTKCAISSMASQPADPFSKTKHSSF